MTGSFHRVVGKLVLVTSCFVSKFTNALLPQSIGRLPRGQRYATCLPSHMERYRCQRWTVDSSRCKSDSEDFKRHENERIGLREKLRRWLNQDLEATFQISNRPQLYRDVLVIFIMAIAQQLGATLFEPNFPGWSAPPDAPHLLGTLNKGSILSTCWVASSMLNNSYNKNENASTSMATTGATWLSASNLYLFTTLMVAAALQQPVPVTDLLVDSLLLLMAISACRGL